MPGSRLEELGALAAMFNDMAAKLRSRLTIWSARSRRGRVERELQDRGPPARERRRWRSVFGARPSASCSSTRIEIPATNRALQAMTGYTGQELQKLSPVDLMAEEEREGARRRLAELREVSGPTTRS